MALLVISLVEVDISGISLRVISVPEIEQTLSGFWWFLFAFATASYDIEIFCKQPFQRGTASPWWFHVFPRYRNAFWCVSRAWAQDRRARPCASDTDPSSSWIRNDGLWCCRDSQFAWAVACDRAVACSSQIRHDSGDVCRNANNFNCRFKHFLL